MSFSPSLRSREIWRYTTRAHIHQMFFSCICMFLKNTQFLPKTRKFNCVFATSDVTSILNGFRWGWVASVATHVCFYCSSTKWRAFNEHPTCHQQWLRKMAKNVRWFLFIWELGWFRYFSHLQEAASSHLLGSFPVQLVSDCAGCFTWRWQRGFKCLAHLRRTIKKK